MADTIRGVCPQCGKKLEIPAELEEFSCLYCGARMRTEALRAKPVEEGAVEALLAQLPGCITRYPDLHLRIGKKDFFPTFAQYEQDNAPLLQELDACCAGYPAQQASSSCSRGALSCSYCANVGKKSFFPMRRCRSG